MTTHRHLIAIFCLMAVLNLFCFNVFGQYTQTVVLTTGSTWTVPDDVTEITVEAWGGGGGGSHGYSMGGGGGGAYATRTFTVTSGEPLNYSIGAGGSGTSSGSKNGGNTWFKSNDTNGLIAIGGTGTSSNTGGAGGLASNCTPNTGAYSGGSGGTSNGMAYYAGGGGGGAGSFENGTNGNNSNNSGDNGAGGTGGNDHGGKGGNGSAGSAKVGENGENYGGGGSAGTDNLNGGNGGSGAIIITYEISCLQPSDLYATQTSPTSYNLGWTANGTETQWNVEVGLQGFTPGTGTQVTGVTGTSNNPWGATGLDSNTQYEFYVQADCEADGTSSWTGPFIFNEQALSIGHVITDNTVCDGDPCDYDGPSILINEVKLYPNWGDGSIYGCVPNNTQPEKCDGEWIELFNPDACEWVDISCYFLGNNAMDKNAADVVANYPGGYIIPEGTLIPPLGFFILRGKDAPEVPSHLLVANGGNTVVAVTDDAARVCYGSGNRLWFPNAAGWFAFYDNNGVPQDAISWNDVTNGLVGYYEGNPVYAPPCMTCSPCNPGPIGNCTHSGTLASYNNIPAHRKTYLGTVGLPANNLELNEDPYAALKGGTFRRTPDGGPWVTGVISPKTYGTCNATCASPIEASCNGEITVTGLGGTPPYTYSWNYLNTQGPVLEGLCAGTYCVTVRDANNDAISECFVVIEDVTIILTASTTTPEICPGETISLNVDVSGGTTPYGFQWVGPAGSGFSSNQQNPNISATTINHNGTYTVTVTDAYGCMAEASVSIIVNPNPIPVANNVSVCEGEEIVLTGGPNGMVSYSWTGPGFTSSEQNPTVSASATMAMAGAYILTVEDNNGCTGSVTMQVGVAVQFDATITPAGPFCFNDAPEQLVAVDGGGMWSGPGVNANTGVFNPSQATIGNNNITYNVGSGSCADSDMITITVNPIPNATITQIGPFCPDDSATGLSAVDGGGTWSGPGVDNDTETFAPSQANIGNNIITYIVTNTYGCTESGEITVIVNPLPVIGITPVSSLCDYEDAILLDNATPTGGTYTMGGIIITEFDPGSAGVGTHEIIYTYTDPATGCTDSRQFTITVYPQPEILIPSIGPLCDYDETVLLEATPAGGTWSGTGVDIDTFDPSQANIGDNIITYVVTSVQGCTNSATITIVVGQAPDIEITQINDLCPDNPDIILTATPTGGTWSGTGITNENNGVFSPSGAEHGENTVYYVFTTPEGCINSDSIIINIFLGDFQVVYVKQDPVCVGGSDGYIDITISGGAPPYTFLIDDVEYPDTGYISGLSAGEYFITITDANGCRYELPEIIINDGKNNCIKIPNAFTPNGDGINDEWLIENINAFPDHYIQVFNRWGQEVYKARHGDAPWDGTYNGNPLPVGPYIYIVKLREKTDNEDEIFVGIVTLIR